MSVNAERTPAEQIECFNKTGAYTIPIIAIATWGVGMSYSAYVGGGWDNIVFGDFATHPAMMLSAFLLVGSFSVCCLQLCQYMGLEYEFAKIIHISLNTLVLILAWLGWWVVWTLHNSSSHYKGSHSRLGIFVLGIWSLYYVMGFASYFIVDKVKFEELYRAFGISCVVVAIWVAALGVMWNEYSYDADLDEYERSRSGSVVGGILLIIFLIVGMLMYARTLLPK